MRQKIRFFILFALFSSMLITDIVFLNAQSAYLKDLENFIKNEYTRFGVNHYDKEMYLVGLMQLTNEEIQDRIGNLKSAKEKYFKSLKTIQDEVRRLKPQLGGPGAPLYKAAEDLEEDIDYSIRNGIVNRSQREAYREALQLLELGARNPSLAAKKASEVNAAPTRSLETVKNALGGDRNVKTPGVTSGKITIYDLFKEWKNTENVDYYKRLLDVELIRKKLYKKGNLTQKQRMFKRELEAAYRAFNSRRYDYASRLLTEILDFYKKVEPRDDIMFYLGEAFFALGENNFALEKSYLPLAAASANSSYLPSVYMRLVQIYYNKKDFAKSLEYAKKYFNVSSRIHRGYDDVLFLGGVAAGRNGDYATARKMLLELGTDSDYYYLAQIIAANLYTVDGMYDKAETILSKMINTKKVPIEYRDKAIVYLGIAYYQDGKYDLAIHVTKKISPEFDEWDLSNMVIAWSDYKRNMLKSPSKRDFTEVKNYSKMVLSGYYGSEYELEAKSLLAQIAEFEGKVDKAVYAFKNIEKYYHFRNAAGEFARERESYQDLKRKSRRVLHKSLANENEAAYQKAKEIEARADATLREMQNSEMSDFGAKLMEEIKTLKLKAAEAEDLKKKAEEEGDEELAKKAGDSALRFYKILNDLLDKADTNEKAYNYFDATPVAKREAEEEIYNEKIEQSREYIMSERENLLDKKKKLVAKIEKAKRDKDYKTVAIGEIYLDEIDELLRKIDRLTTVAYANELKDNKSRVKEWADFGAFGVVNSQIMEKDKAGKLQSLLGKKVSEINDLLDTRRTSIENKIFRIEEEIALMTRKVKEQRRRREREEKFREFEESYFERRESETEIEGAGVEIKDEESPSGERPEEAGEIMDIKDAPPPENEIKDEPAQQPADKKEDSLEGDLQDELNKLPGGGDEN